MNLQRKTYFPSFYSQTRNCKNEVRFYLKSRMFDRRIVLLLLLWLIHPVPELSVMVFLFEKRQLTQFGHVPSCVGVQSGSHISKTMLSLTQKKVKLNGRIRFDTKRFVLDTRTSQRREGVCGGGGGGGVLLKSQSFANSVEWKRGNILMLDSFFPSSFQSFIRVVSVRLPFG